MLSPLVALFLAQSAPRLEVPKAIWEPIFFESIDRRAMTDRLPNLRRHLLPAGDFEMRVWEGFGLTLLQGIRLQRTSGRWSASWIRPIIPALPKRKGYLEVLPATSDQVASAWQRVSVKGVLTLPDSESLPNQKQVLDGMSYVVEYQQNGAYRTYCYNNPDYQAKTLEVRRILEIVKILDGSFGLPVARKRLDTDMAKLRKLR